MAVLRKVPLSAAPPIADLRPGAVIGRASVGIPGTCGELVQGAIGGKRFLVSCPIDRYATATVEVVASTLAPSLPADSPKAVTALRAALAFFGCPAVTAHLRLDSALPRGKGMASSTADVVSVIYAVAAALGRPISQSQVAALAVSVEPSDATMFPNIALFDHRHGAWHEEIGPPPSLDIVVLDLGGEVDTVEFNRRDYSRILEANEPQVVEALSLVRRGIREGRIDLIGRGATLSADANQLILAKERLEDVKTFARAVGGLGVNVAHSGTVVGILLDPIRGDTEEILRRVKEDFPLAAAFSTCLVGGGPRPGEITSDSLAD